MNGWRIPGCIALAVAALLLGVYGGGARAVSGSPEPPALEYRTDRVLVTFRSNLSLRTRLEAVERHGLAPDPRWSSPYFARLRVPGAPAHGGAAEQQRLKGILAALRTDPAVRDASPDWLVRPTLIPDDPRFGELYGLHNTGQGGGTADADIDAPEAWDISTGSDSVIVGVIDTGVDYNHPDLTENILRDAQGRVVGIDAANGDDDPMDDHGHGTHCAGTIGARGNNGIGVVGVCHRVKIMPLKFLSSGGSGYISDAIVCMDFARQNGARILSNSWGGGGASQAMRDALARARDADILFVAAAGNNGSNNDLQPFYPARYSTEFDNVIAVAATDNRDAIAGFSNYGEQSVLLGAPGVSILSTVPGSGYALFSGTSMACPHVSGVAALILSRVPGFTSIQLKGRLASAVDEIPALQGKTITGGRVNAAAAMAGSGDTTPPGAPRQFVVTHRSSNALLMQWRASGDDGLDGTAARLELRYSAVPLTEANFGAAPSVEPSPLPAPSGTVQSAVLPGLEANRDYWVGIRALDDAGNRSPVVTAGPTRTRRVPDIRSPLYDDVEGSPLFSGQSPWAVSSERSFSPTRSYTDSPGNDYQNNLDISLTQNASTPISGIVPYLSYHLFCQLEDNFDFLNVEISRDNGATWTGLSSHTGLMDWREHRLPLTSFAGASVKIRFRLVTDASFGAAGVFVDDIRIYGDRLAPVSEEETAPAAPSNLASGAVGANRVDLNWKRNSTNESGFKIERRRGTGSFSLLHTTPAGAIRYSDTTTEEGTTYTYRVKATNPIGDSAPSNETTVTTPLTPPAPPEELTAQALSSTEVELRWQDRSTNEAQFLVERREGTGAFAQVAALAAGTTRFRNTGLQAERSYGFRVRAANSGGNSAYSNIATVSTPPARPTAPAEVAATLVTATSIRVTWRDTSTSETGFEVRRRIGTGAFEPLRTVGAGVEQLTDGGLERGTRYSYQVRALGATQHSSWVGPAVAETPPLPPAPPEELTAAADGNGVKLEWKDVSTNETGFRVERRETGAWAQVGLPAANARTFTDNSVDPNTAYSYRVRAVNAGGESAPSNTVAVRTPLRKGGTLRAPASVTFGTVPRSKAVKKNVVIENTATSENLEVTVTAPGAPYSLLAGAGTHLLPPGGKVTLQVRFRPTKKSTYRGSILLRSSDTSATTHTIRLSGKGK
jgi:hypothetical protein